jgi:hypothetical protein
MRSWAVSVEIACNGRQARSPPSPRTGEGCWNQRDGSDPRVFNNESLNFVNMERQEAGYVPFGTDFKNPNFAKVAEAMGAKGIRLEEPGDVKDALAEALAHNDGPVVVGHMDTVIKTIERNVDLL